MHNVIKRGIILATSYSCCENKMRKYLSDSLGYCGVHGNIPSFCVDFSTSFSEKESKSHTKAFLVSLFNKVVLMVSLKSHVK